MTPAGLGLASDHSSRSVSMRWARPAVDREHGERGQTIVFAHSLFFDHGVALFEERRNVFMACQFSLRLELNRLHRSFHQ